MKHTHKEEGANKGELIIDTDGYTHVHVNERRDIRDRELMDVNACSSVGDQRLRWV